MLFARALPVLSFAGTALGNPVSLGVRQLLPSPPSATIKNGTVIGKTVQGVDAFSGIPFARPPTGSLRLRPPQPVAQGFGTLTATSVPTACPQISALGYDVGAPSTPVAPQGEDCLTLCVQRPAGVAADAKLPVLFWIYGGGFEGGSTAQQDGAQIVKKSVDLGHPIIFVQSNYRLGGFGFLPGKELQADGSTNLGLRDQRKALEWVAENIKDFGGDPNKVTLWGESAGSISVYDQLLVNRGNNEYAGSPLFRAAIMDSGSIFPATDVASTKPQAIYDALAAKLGCSGAASLACLRAAPYDKFAAAAADVPGLLTYQSLDVTYLPRPDPNSDFFPTPPGAKDSPLVRVPVINGNQEDEGTFSAIPTINVTSTDALISYMSGWYPTAPHSDIVSLVDLYPSDPAAGSPFETGLLNELYPGFKRNAALFGDAGLIMQRRAMLEDARTRSPSTPAWSYLATYDHGTPILGTFHTSDVLELFDGLIWPEPADAGRTYYISFVNFLDPNVISTAKPLVQWPQWQLETRQMLNFSTLGNSIINDRFREAAGDFIQSHADVLQF